MPSESSTQFSGCLVLLNFSSSPSIIIQASIDQLGPMSQTTGSSLTARTKTPYDLLKLPIRVASCQGGRKPVFYKPGKDTTASLTRLLPVKRGIPNEDVNLDISIPPPGYQDSDSPDASPLLRRGAGTLVHTIIIND